jgi:hypothetical protein
LKEGAGAVVKWMFLEGEEEGKGKSRFPAGMTARKARAKATAGPSLRSDDNLFL